MPAGRPPIYRVEMCERVVELGKQGCGTSEIALELGVTRETVRVWGITHEEFSDALKQAKDYALAWWERAGRDGIYAEKFNAAAFIFQMKNRFRDDYSDRQVVDQNLSGRVEFGVDELMKAIDGKTRGLPTGG